MAQELVPRSSPAPDAAGMGTSNAYPNRGSVDHGLPEDDGMRPMRKKIVDIQKLDVSASEKSRLIHAVMTEQYTSTLARRQGIDIPHSDAAESSSQGHASSLGSDISHLGHSYSESSVSSNIGVGDTVSSADRMPTYWIPPANAGLDKDPIDSPPRRYSFDSDEDEDDAPIFGCQHYMRNVKLQCSTCFRWYTCRFCHDESEAHKLIRRDTKKMLCMFCGCAQPAAGVCCECGVSAAYYYCHVCKLWDNDSTKSIYHCDDCGICRRGAGLGKDFFHCKTCRACLSVSIRETHRCIERSTDCDCPICGEYMFTSPQTVVFMRCGHSIHLSCYGKHKLNSFKCPICSRSIINMELTFQNLDRAIEAQPMPPQFQDTTALVYCNDCCARSSVRYHWLGLKCAHCDSYNTAQIQILSNEAPIRTPSAVTATPTLLAPPDERLTHPHPHLSPASPPGTSREPSRGRTTVSGSGSGAGTPRRAATSASAVASPRRGTLLAFLRNVHSFSGVETSRPPSSSGDSEDAASDDDVDFLGLFPRRRRRSEAVLESEESEEESEEEEEPDMLLEDEDESDEDPMDILGHR